MDLVKQGKLKSSRKPQSSRQSSKNHTMMQSRMDLNAFLTNKHKERQADAPPATQYNTTQ